MPRLLSAEEVDAYRSNGFHFPVSVLGLEEIRQYRLELEEIERDFGAEFKTDLHLLKKWAWNLVHDARILDAVEDVLGPNILCWGLHWFIKEPFENKIVTWHQDSNYWGLYPHDVTTAWLALSDAGIATGPMKFIPTSHLMKDYEHEDTFDKSNLLSRGQKIVEPLAESSSVLAPMKAGEMSLHHVRIVHGSDANTTSDRRIGMAIRYAATNVKQGKLRDTAVLVRGEDAFGHFDLLDAPETEMGELEIARQRDAVARTARIIHSKDYE